MDGFLKSLANHLFEQHKNEISNLTMVFPNRRAGVFFTSYLNELVTAPLFAPEILTINELFTHHSKWHVADPLSLVFRLYRVYQGLTGSEERFDDFYHWGEMLVNDFDDVDKYLVDASALFVNVTELKEIDLAFDFLDEEHLEHVQHFWQSLTNKGKSENQKTFLKIWQALNEIYTSFKEILEEEGIAYEGMVYRELATKLRDGVPGLLGDRHYVFAGFNALNRCEESLFSYLRDQQQASFYWDYDTYYLRDTAQEAGLFMRKNLVNFPQQEAISSVEAFRQKSKKTRVIEVSSQVSQAQVAAHELESSYTESTKFDDIAVVLCDEELLLPVLGAIPKPYEHVNVTMGFPLKSTPAYSFILQLIALQRNVKVDHGEVKFYFKDVQPLLNHQLVATIEPENARVLSSHITLNNRIYISPDELGLSDFLKQVFTFPFGIAALSEYFLGLIREVFLLLKTKESSGESELFQEYLFQFYLSVNRLKDILENDGARIFGKNEFMHRETYFRFLQHYLQRLSIPYEGEPLLGLQVMGILETRTLDFEKLIILSMNDGVMPKTSPSGSFIPYNLRRGFGLPSIEEQNAMYAYYFYRLLQRAGDITFVYNSSSEGLSTGEKSRYLYQLEMESDLEVVQQSVGFDISTIMGESITVEKTERVMAPLEAYLTGERVLSPSAIDKFLACPLQFYFRYCARLHEPDEVTEEVDARIFGNLFHESMEMLYQPFLSKEILKEDIEHLRHDEELIERAIKAAFKKNFFKGIGADKITLTGRNWLVFEIVRKYVKQVLVLDEARAPFVVSGLEQKVKAWLPINQGETKVLVGGSIDRVDGRKNGFEILDYKTGQADLSFATLNDLFDTTKKNRNKAALQTLIYSWVMEKNHPGVPSVVPGIYYLRGIFEDNFQPMVRCKSDGNEPVNYVSRKEAFQELLINTLERLFDRSLPFEQTEHEETCTHCPYREICRKG